MVLSAFGRAQKERLENTEGQTVQQQGEDDLAWIQRMCAINAQRCREDPRHHTEADQWQHQRELRNAKREEEEKIRQQQQKELQMTAAHNKEKAARNKHIKDGHIECYEDPGRPHDADWLRGEVAPLCSDFRPGIMMSGVGVLAIRHGLDRLAEMKTMGRPIKSPYYFVLETAMMVHQGRYTFWADPEQGEVLERLIVPKGESPFERRMIKHDDGSWGMPDPRVEIHWPIKVPNADGYLPGTRPQTKETPVKLSDIGKLDKTKEPKPFTRLGDDKPWAEIEAAEAKPARKIVQPPLRNDPAPAPVAAEKAEPEPDTLMQGDPNIVKAYRGPPPSKAWCEMWLYKYLPEQRGVALKPLVSQIAYRKALIETLAIDRSTWTPMYRRDCFSFMLDKFHGMTEADVERETQLLAEQQAEYSAKMTAANAPQADRPRMREPGED